MRQLPSPQGKGYRKQPPSSGPRIASRTPGQALDRLPITYT